MRIDIHTHAFHEKIASKFIAALGNMYGLLCQGDGTVEGLEQAERIAGMDHYLVLNAAATPNQVVPANNASIQIHNDPSTRALAFGTVRPDYIDWEKELDRLEANGIHGLKFHPDFQGFRLDDPSLRPIYEACSKRFILLFHVGCDEASLSKATSSPYMIRSISEAFPDLDIIAAHFGSYSMWDMALDAFDGYKGEHLWFDTSSSVRFVGKKTLDGLFSILPPERYFFGTDWPILTPDQEIEVLLEAGISPRRIDELLANAEPLLRSYKVIV